MIPEEATWLRKRIHRFAPRFIVNFGSSTLAFRTIDQPFISECFGRFETYHLDKKEDPGVDFCIDLEAEDFRTRFQVAMTMKGKSLSEFSFTGMGVLSNVLEHTDNPGIVLQNVALTSPRWLYVSVPNEWPYHPDPIDNGYRPTPTELVKLVEWYGYKALEWGECFCPRGRIAVATFKRETE